MKSPPQGEKLRVKNQYPSSLIRAQRTETSMELGGAKEGPDRENSPSYLLLLLQIL